MKTVMIFGTFDILHPGHKYFIKQAKKYGDYLITIVARDRTVKRLKGRLPINSEKQRLEAVKGLKLASKVALGNLTDKYRAIKKYRPDIICLGYDQHYFVDQLKQLNFKIKIIRLKAYRPKKYKTSIIKKLKKL